MSVGERVVGVLSRSAHPRLLVLLLAGAAVGLLGSVLLVAGGQGLRTLGFRLAVVGYLAFLAGASGYLAFAVFERGFD